MQSVIDCVLFETLLYSSFVSLIIFVWPTKCFSFEQHFIHLLCVFFYSNSWFVLNYIFYIHRPSNFQCKKYGDLCEFRLIRHTRDGLSFNYIHQCFCFDFRFFRQILTILMNVILINLRGKICWYVSHAEWKKETFFSYRFELRPILSFSKKNFSNCFPSIFEFLWDFSFYSNFS